MAYRIIFFIQLAAVLAAAAGLISDSEWARSLALLIGVIGVGAFLRDAWVFASERDQ